MTIRLQPSRWALVTCLVFVAGLAGACGPREPRTDAERLARGKGDCREDERQARLGESTNRDDAGGPGRDQAEWQAAHADADA